MSAETPAPSVGDVVVVRFPGHAMDGRIGTVEPCSRANDVHVRIDGTLWCFGQYHVAPARAADRARSLLKMATPGPWRVSDRDSIAPAVSGRWLVAVVHGDDDDRPWNDEIDPGPGPLADAELIAAAPDLARDLIAAEEANERVYDNARTEIGRLRDALALAERERDEARAELAAAWEETGHPPGCNTLAGAVRWALRGQYNRAELSEILGRREGETTAEAARRVVAERDGARATAVAARGEE